MTAVLIPVALLWPAALLGAWAVPASRPLVRRLSPTLALPALVLAIIGDTTTRVVVEDLFTGVAFGVDATGRPFLLLTAALWTVCAQHATSYLRNDPRRDGFTAFLLATAIGSIGITIALDGLGFYLFFSLLTFAAYGLIIHVRSAAAMRAGRIYIIMAVAGEALLLAGLFRLAAQVPSMTFPTASVAAGMPPHATLTTALLLAGFGIKAGLMPLHVWLPLAHPVAPTPASALLSGVLIKAGVLGWLRYLPLGSAGLPALGAAVIVLGMIATLYGAIIGVMQRDAKTVLAYSSISQIGFMAVGTGAALMVPGAAGPLVAAVAIYAVHHAFAKAALFLSLGAVPAAASARWSAWLIPCALPGLALAGAPLTSGALAKAALRDALGGLPLSWSTPIDTLLGVAAVGTTLLIARYLVALRAAPDSLPPDARPGLVAPWLTLVALSAVAAVWLPAITAAAAEIPLFPGIGYAAAALWPLVLGVITSIAAALLARRHPALASTTAPAGDIVHFVERTARRLAPAAATLAYLDPAAPLRRLGDRLARFGLRTIRAIESADAGLAREPGWGALLALIAVAIFMALALT